jgi:hypothetical protein
MSAALERRVEQLEQANSPARYVWRDEGESTEAALLRYGVPANQEDRVVFVRWQEDQPA